MYTWFSTFNPRLHVAQLSKSFRNTEIWGGKKHALITQMFLNVTVDSLFPSTAF